MAAIARKASERNDDKRMELTEHLGELRTRIIRSLWYLVFASIVAYQFFGPLYGMLYKPLDREMRSLNHQRIQKEIHRQAEGAKGHLAADVLIVPHATHDPPTREEFNRLADSLAWFRDHPVATPLMSIVFRNFHEPFMVRLTISCVCGFIIALPMMVYELALFITPALTLTERKPLKKLVPLSVVLLIFGVLVAYCTMFYAMGWFLGYLDDFPQPAVLMQDPNDYVLFFVKMMAAFGIAFQLPVVLMGLAFAGIVSSRWLLKNWRVGFLVAFLGGLFTPANDPMSWALMVIPLLFLYAVSILLVKWVEKQKTRQSPTAGT